MSLLVVVPTTSFNGSFYFPTREGIVRPVWKSACLLSPFSCFFSFFRTGFVRFVRPSRALVSSFCVSIFCLFQDWRVDGAETRGDCVLSLPHGFFLFFLFARRSSGTVYRSCRYVVRIIATAIVPGISNEISKSRIYPLRTCSYCFVQVLYIDICGFEIFHVSCVLFFNCVIMLSISIQESVFTIVCLR